MITNRRFKHLILTFFSFILFVLPVAADTAGNKKVVRVGWYDSTFNLLDADGRRSGYGYEYQQRIAANTDWEYEYVEESWPVLFEMLKRGEIDLLSDVSYTPERAKEMLFSEREMGIEDYYITTLSTNKDISVGEMRTLEGKRIGVNAGSYQAKLLRDWEKMRGVHVQIVEMDRDEEDYVQMMQRGEIDAMATVNAFNNVAENRCLPIIHIGSSGIYFAINKQRPDLKMEIDKAMSQIRSHSVYYNRDLHEKYFSHTNVYQYLPRSETQWLQKHGKIRIAYRDNYLPFCAHDAKTGEVKGLLRDFIDKMTGTFQNASLEFEAIPYPTINEAIEATKRGEADAVFPNGMDVFGTEQMGMLTTDAFVKSAEMAVVRNDDFFNPDRHNRAAINANNPTYITLVKMQYPEWELVHYNSTRECLEGVANGEADLLLTSNYRLSILNNELEQLELKAVATGSTITLSFAMRRGEKELFSIMSRIIHMMSETEIHASLARNSEMFRRTSVMDFIKSNYYLVVILLVIVLGIYIYLFRKSRKEHLIAEAASQAKTRFLFNMSHDIRTPMNAIIGYADLMNKNLDDKEKSKDYLYKIRTSGRFLLGLINNVLEMSRIESGKMEIVEKPCRLSEVLKDVKSLYAEMMKKKDIDFTFQADMHTQVVYCDQVKLSEIYLNLLSNAYKYTPKGGRVNIMTQELPSEREGYARVRSIVSDTGIGMSEEYLPHVFEDFTREQTYTDNKIAGTGLGMSIVKRLVDMMHGTITVESTLGKGTTFTVTIEHRIASEEDLKNEDDIMDKPENPFEGKHILLAEDNELNAEIAIEILKMLGFCVSHASDGVQCVEMLNNAEPGTYDAILMDIQMPNMNGYDATRAIRALPDPAKAHIPIVAMTANAFDEDKKNAFEAGMDGHLAKPIDVSKLTETLSRLIIQNA